MSSNPYKRTQRIDTLGDLPGADQARNLLRIGAVAQDVTLKTEVAQALNDAADGLVVEPVSGTFVVEGDGPLDVSAATVDVQEDTPLDVSGATVTVTEGSPVDVSGSTVPVDHQGVIDVSSRDGRNLGEVEVNALPDADFVSGAGDTLGASSSVTYSISALGADGLDGRAKSSGSYDLEIRWMDGNGNVLQTTSVASGVAGGTWTDITGETAISPFADVVITDTSGADQTADLGLHLR